MTTEALEGFRCLMESFSSTATERKMKWKTKAINGNGRQEAKFNEGVERKKLIAVENLRIFAGHKNVKWGLWVRCGGDVT